MHMHVCVYGNSCAKYHLRGSAQILKHGEGHGPFEPQLRVAFAPLLKHLYTFW